MRIEGRQHAFHGSFDQLRFAGLLDIIRPDPLEDVTEQIKLTVGIGVGRRSFAENVKL
jgi:hypothetical protein